MDVKQYQDYLRNIKFLIHKTADDWHVQKEYPHEGHDDDASGCQHDEYNGGVHNKYPSGGDVIMNGL